MLRCGRGAGPERITGAAAGRLRSIGRAPSPPPCEPRQTRADTRRQRTDHHGDRRAGRRRPGSPRVHMLAWRDLDDDEAGGSEVHAHNIASIWAQAGISGDHAHLVRPPGGRRRRCATATGRAAAAAGTRCSPGRRWPRSRARYGPCDGLVEIWNGMPFMSPLWWRGPAGGLAPPRPRPDVGHDPARARGRGSACSSRSASAPRLYRHQPIVTLSPSSEEELVDDLGFDRGAGAGHPPRGGPLLHPRRRHAPPRRWPWPWVGWCRSRTSRAWCGSWARVVPRQVPDAELVIVGEGYERPDDRGRGRRACGVADWVRLPGRISDDELRDLYRRAWMVASVSVREGWGMTLTEAAACGTPTVATDIAGHADAVAAGRSGLLADHRRRPGRRPSPSVLTDDDAPSRPPGRRPGPGRRADLGARGGGQLRGAGRRRPARQGRPRRRRAARPVGR